MTSDYKDYGKKFLARRYIITIVGWVVSTYFIFLWASLSGTNRQANQDGYHTQRAITKQFNYGDKLKSRIRMEIWISEVNTGDKLVKAKVFFFPTKYLVSEDSFPGIAKALLADFKYQRISYPVNSLMKPTEVSFPIRTGSNFYYPFSPFEAEVNFKVISVEDNTPIPIKVDMLITTPGLWFDVVRFNAPAKDPNATALADDAFIAQQLGIYQFKLSVSRSIEVIVFSLAVVVVLWVLTVAYLVLLRNLVRKAYIRPAGAYLGLGPSLLFAMPALRYIQPGVPPPGILLDMVGFFW